MTTATALEIIRTIDGQENFGLVTVGMIEKHYPMINRTELDAVLVELSRNGLVWLSEHDWPQGLSAEARTKLIDGRYNAVGLR